MWWYWKSLAPMRVLGEGLKIWSLILLPHEPIPSNSWQEQSCPLSLKHTNLTILQLVGHLSYVCICNIHGLLTIFVHCLLRLRDLDSRWSTFNFQHFSDCSWAIMMIIWWRLLELEWRTRRVILSHVIILDKVYIPHIRASWNWRFNQQPFIQKHQELFPKFRILGLFNPYLICWS